MKRLGLLLVCTLTAAATALLPALPAEARHGACNGTITPNGATPQGGVTPAPSGMVQLTATFTGNGPGFIPEECDIGWVNSCTISLNGTPLDTTCTATPGDTRGCSVVSCTVNLIATGAPVGGTNTASASIAMQWGCCLWRGGPEVTSTIDWSFSWLTDCVDGIDNDGDGSTDHPNDPGCSGTGDMSERGATACDNGLDDDSDGSGDYPADPGCSSPADTSEATDCGETAPGIVVCATPGAVWLSQSVRAQDVLPGDEHSVVGYIDAYRFSIPGVGQTLVPCVVLVADGSTVNPCAAAGGEFVDRRQVLVNEGLDEPDPAEGEEVARLQICRADYRVLVLGFGVESFAGYAVC